MKTVKSVANLEAKFFIELTENEARALQEFAYFGAYDQTIKFVTNNWHTKINEKHLKEFFETVNSELQPHLSRVDKARDIFNAETKDS